MQDLILVAIVGVIIGAALSIAEDKIYFWYMHRRDGEHFGTQTGQHIVVSTEGNDLSMKIAKFDYLDDMLAVTRKLKRKEWTLEQMAHELDGKSGVTLYWNKSRG